MVTLDWVGRHLLHIKYIGTVTGEEIIQSALEAAGDERFDYIRFVLGDWSQHERSEITQEHVRTLVAVMKPTSMICPHAKNATVIRPDRSGNALVAFYKMLVDDLTWDCEIFHTFEEAYSWFGMETPDQYKGIRLDAPAATTAETAHSKGE